MDGDWVEERPYLDHCTLAVLAWESGENFHAYFGTMPYGNFGSPNNFGSHTESHQVTFGHAYRSQTQLGTLESGLRDSETGIQ